MRKSQFGSIKIFFYIAQLKKKQECCDRSELKTQNTHDRSEPYFPPKINPPFWTSTFWPILAPFSEERRVPSEYSYRLFAAD